MILVIILGILSWVDGIRREVSEKRVFEGFEKAVRSPDGSIIFEDDLVLAPGSAFSSRTFSSMIIGMVPECVELQTNTSSAFSEFDGRIVEVNTLITTGIYYRCERIYDPDHDCETTCLVSFGKEIEIGP